MEVIGGIEPPSNPYKGHALPLGYMTIGSPARTRTVTESSRGSYTSVILQDYAEVEDFTETGHQHQSENRTPLSLFLYPVPSWLVASGRLELPSGGPEPPMIAATLPGLMFVMLQESSVLINKSLINHFLREIGWKKAFLYVLVHLITRKGQQIVMLIY